MCAQKRATTPGVQPRQRRTEVVNFSVTEENPRHGDAGTPGVPPAGRTRRSVRPAVPSHAARPSTPPTSATPVIRAAPAAATPSAAPPAPHARPALRAAGQRGPTLGRAPRSRHPERPGTPALASAARLACRDRSPLGRRIRRQGPQRLGAAAAVLVVVGLLVWWAVASFAGSAKPLPRIAQPGPRGVVVRAPASRGALPLEGVSPLDFQLRRLLQGLRSGCAAVHRGGLRHRALGPAGRRREVRGR